jgi:hypothetical protein
MSLFFYVYIFHMIVLLVMGVLIDNKRIELNYICTLSENIKLFVWALEICRVFGGKLKWILFLKKWTSIVFIMHWQNV